MSTAPSWELRESSEPFEREAFDKLWRLVFDPLQHESEAWAQVLQAEQATRDALALPPAAAQPPVQRVGVYLGDELIGWTSGWTERGHVFYMGSSGVHPAHRRQGIYTALLQRVIEQARAQGAVAVRSQHSVLNHAILLAKLAHGFQISGLTTSAQMGTLVELTLHLSPGRAAAFAQRVVPHASPVIAPASTAAPAPVAAAEAASPSSPVCPSSGTT